MAEGFTVLKVKVGADPATDLARVARRPRRRRRRDADAARRQPGLDREEAVRVIRAARGRRRRLELVEQPVAAADLEGLRWVTDRVRTPILADESVFGVRDLVEVIRSRAADMVNVKLAKCGGLAPPARCCRWPRRTTWAPSSASMMESAVGVGAAASLVAACGTTAVSDLDAAWWLASSPVVGGLTYEASTVVLPDAPGLGLTLPPSAQRHRPALIARIGQWGLRPRIWTVGRRGRPSGQNEGEFQRMIEHWRRVS